MRTTRRFTPQLIRRWLEAGRGTGRLTEYIPWHQVTRGDPASRGRSHLLIWQDRERLIHLLSDGELIAFYFSTMLPDVFDIREQFPLSVKDGPHELGLYSTQYSSGSYAGTLEIARRLSLKHPKVKQHEEFEWWRLSTDLLVTRHTGGTWSLLAVSVKNDAEKLSRRNRELLRVEQHYWQERGASWLLLTPQQYDSRVGKCLQRAAAWVMPGQPIGEGIRERCAARVKQFDRIPLITVLRGVVSEFSVEQQEAQRIFWQSVWHGNVPMDLRQGWRSEESVRLLTADDFLKLNPLGCGRSACYI